MAALVLVMAFKADAAAITKKELKTKYTSWLKKHDYELSSSSEYMRGKVKYVDINGDKTLDAIYSSYAGGHVILSYNKSTKKVKKIKSMYSGKGGFCYYNKKKHMVALSNSTTGSYDTYFYKISGLKATKKKAKSFTSYRNYPSFNWTYKAGGKKVSQKAFKKKMKSALKGYKKVTPVSWGAY